VDQVARIGSTVDRGDTDKRVWQRLAGAWRASARAHQCSSVTAEEEEDDEAKPVRGSPKHGRRRRGVARAKDGSRKLGRDGKKGR
jgi:hypothetical protein